ncbi:hypothetical protein [Streptomyces sp. NPDC048603]|uniref:hypothetical protein n=1 Tax=Streptomyces sp. NPDC048603 TaxID=3365577 RepID=UPI0037151154
MRKAAFKTLALVVTAALAGAWAAAAPVSAEPPPAPEPAPPSRPADPGRAPLGLEEIVGECRERGRAALGLGAPCTAYFTEGDGAVWLSQRFADLDAEYAALVDGLRRRNPGARVGLAGYPALAQPPDGCPSLEYGPVARADLPWLGSLGRRLNDLIRDQTARHGADFTVPGGDHGWRSAGSGGPWRDGCDAQVDRTGPALFTGPGAPAFPTIG